MPVVHQFTYGPASLVAAYLMSFSGSLLGLAATARARRAAARGRRFRWLAIAAVSIGGGIWLMHFVAMLGFDIPASPVRYRLMPTILSALLAVAVVGLGMLVVGTGRRYAVARVIVGGALTGLGVSAMHYTGMAAVHVDGTIGYDGRLVAASVVIAVLASMVALLFTITVRGWRRITTAAAVMAVAVCGMHYTGMAAMRVHLHPDPGPVAGIDPILFVLPISTVACAVLVALVMTALQAMTQEEFELQADFTRPVVLTGQIAIDAPAVPDTPPAPQTPEPGTPRPTSLAVISRAMTVPSHAPGLGRPPRR